MTEALASVRVVAFDKTGTLTTDTPGLIEVAGDGLAADDVLRWAAGLERHAGHPLARSIVDVAAARSLPPMAATDVQALPGCGVQGRVRGRSVFIGSPAWMRQLGAAMPADLAERMRTADGAGRTVVCLARDDRVIGLLVFDDVLLPEASIVVAAVRGMGLQAGILSGAGQGVVDRVGASVGIERRQGELSPADKRAALERWRRWFGPVAMVGDGLNDGPVLAAADVGIAVGSATDLARAAADLVLPENGLALLPWVLRLMRTVRRTILTNLLWAFGYNLVAIALAAAGYLQPIAAALVMAGSSLVVVLNSLQIERHGEPDDRLPPIADFPHAQPAQ